MTRDGLAWSLGEWQMGAGPWVSRRKDWGCRMPAGVPLTEARCWEPSPETPCQVQTWAP